MKLKPLVLIALFSTYSFADDLSITHESINGTLGVVDFGSVLIGHSSDAVINFYNSESVDVLDNCGTYKPNKPEFTIVGQTCADWANYPDAPLTSIAVNSGSSCSVTLRFAPTTPIDHNSRFRLYCNDSSYNGNSRPSFFVDLSGSAIQPPTAPTFSQSSPVAISMDEDSYPRPFSLTLHAADVNNDTINWSVAEQGNFGVATVSGTGKSKAISYVPKPNYFGADSFVVQVSDGVTGSATQIVNVTVNSINDAPTISGRPTTTVSQGDSYRFVPTVTDIDTDESHTFSISNKPSWASFNSQTGLLSGTPGNSGVGTTAGIIISVTDSVNATASLAPFALMVTNVNDAPTISGRPSTSVNEGELYSFTPEVNDVDTDDTLTFAITNKPSWASFNQQNGSLTGTPENSDVGISESISISVSDGQATVNLAAFNINVINVNQAPVADAQFLTVNEDNSIAVTLSATDIDADAALSFSIVGLPAYGALTINQQAVEVGKELAVATLTYMPELNYSGNDAFEFAVSDGIKSAKAVVKITVLAVNDDPVSIGVISAEMLSEDQVDAVPFTAEALLVNINDADDDLAEVVVDTYEGTYGNLFQINGSWVYQYKHHIVDQAPEEQPDNDDGGIDEGIEDGEVPDVDTDTPADDSTVVDPSAAEDLVETLRENEMATETIEFNVRSLNDASPELVVQTLTFSIQGKNDLPEVIVPEVFGDSQTSEISFILGQAELLTPDVTDIDKDTVLAYTLSESGDDAYFNIDELGVISLIEPVSVSLLAANQAKASYSVKLIINDGFSPLERQINFTLETNGDVDGDGESDALEIEQGTNPYDGNDYLDSDNDGESDALEIAQGSDPHDASSYQDQDKDGVPDYVEILAGTNPNDSKNYQDTDFDGVPDYQELIQGTSAEDGTDFIDSDGDGVSDHAELIDNTDINNPSSFLDSDGDGVPDQQELINGTDPQDENSFQDTDADTVSDYQEGLANTDPNDPNDYTFDTDNDGVYDDQELLDGTDPLNGHDFIDSDKDGVADKLEIFNGTDPNDNTSYIDSDNDLVSDYQERMNETDHFDKFSYLDSDGDGVADYAEMLAQTDPLNKTSFIDSDGDGVADYVEILRGTDPNSAADKDADGDGVPDVQEEVEQSDPNDINSFLDSDADFVPDFVELQQGTDPFNRLDFIDNDEDGMSDAEENRVGTDANDATDFIDSDGDRVSDREELKDNTDPYDSASYLDSDGDLLPDAYERRYGLDALAPFDAELDFDGDGLSNLTEYQQGTPPDQDSVAPNLSVDDVIWVNATRAMTPMAEMNLLSQTAFDLVDGDVDLEWPITVFAPGQHQVTVSATDIVGNKAEKQVTLNVRPLISFRVKPSELFITEGKKFAVKLQLNGYSPTYPLVVAYQVSGSAESMVDHNLQAGVAVFNDRETQAIIEFDTLTDERVEADENIVITAMSQDVGIEEQSINLGFGAEVTLTLTESNLAPAVSVAVVQDSQDSPWVDLESGRVKVKLNIADLNIADSHSITWHIPDQLVVSYLARDAFEFIPSRDRMGTHKLGVTVVDSGTPAKTTHHSLSIVVRERLAALSAIDSDHDGILDTEEGYKDSDVDGIPDFLDNQFLSQSEVAVSQNNLESVAKVANTLRLVPGQLALATAGLLIEQGRELDPDYINVGGIFDFEIKDLADNQTTATVVLPLQTKIPANAYYRKETPSAGWMDFIEDDKNIIQSASGLDGQCPDPGSNLYEHGLRPGYMCLQLTIEDGGLNDADGIKNGTIVDPGGIAILSSDEPSEEVVPEKNNSGGAINLAWVTMLLCGIYFRNRKERNNKELVS
ncbi:Ig-like domain-containing protein [Shewanella sp. 0m-4]